MKLPCLPAFASSAQVLVALLLAAFTSDSPARSQTTLAPSDRVVINLGQTQWRYMKDSPNALPANPQSVTLDDSKWQIVGLPYSTNQAEMFQNQQSGGGDGNMPGNVAWYRHHFTMAPQYAGKKVLVEFEGVHTGAQVWINGTFLPGNSVLNPQATHVVGFVGFVVDITPYLHFDGTTDNVLAVSSAKNASWFASPNFSQGFRFGQADSGIFRPVTMYITDKIHIPQNTAAGLGTWGTYVATLAASDTSATVEVQTNVLNEGTSAQAVTLTTQIVDAAGNVVATNQDSKVIPANAGPGLTPTLFDETLTVANPTLWYPNNSIYGKPYMYKVFHTLSMNGVVIDAVQSPLGIRTLTWDKNVPYFNGKAHFLWGGSGRYDYPALGTSVPAEQEWRDLQQIAAAGGSLWRPGHSSQSPEFLDAADAYGVMVVQPSGDGENGFANPCDPTCDKATLKKELHRDMILRDRNHPSILAWEADNGITDTTFAQSLKALSLVYDPIAQHVQADRTPNPANGDILGCTLEGCEVGVKNQYPNSPAWGSEYWGTGTARQSYDYELAFAAPFLDNWRKGRVANAFGMAQWYFADSPGETSTYVEGTPDASVRSLGASMVDMNRFPKMLYKIYQAAWVPYQIKPVVSLAHHWNRAGNITVNAFSNCPAVRLLINGVAQGADQVPNPWTTDGSANLTQTTTNIAGQVHWNVTWAAGTVTAECLDAYGNVKATDSKTTAGQPDHIELDVVPELVKPDGTAFQITANGSDAAFIVAKVVDANGVVVPTASNNITFAVNGPGTYQGGSEQLVTAGQPYSYHAPFDPELQAEGGLTKIVVRSQFTSGTVTVTATSPGLGNGTASYAVAPVASTAPTAAAPAIIAQPTNTAVTAGQPATFSVTASGAATLLFQWKKNGVAIAGANSATYTTPATSLADNGATFSVVISNSLGSASSSAATLTVVAAAAPAITAQPVSLTATVGQTATFSVTATGSPTLTYQWRKNGTPIAGAIYPSYTTPVLAATDNGEVYTVVVTNPVNAATSAAATLTVNAAQAPVITTQPANTTGIPGQPANLTVAVSGSTPMSFQWQRNGNNVGTNSPTYSIAALQTTDVGSYTVTATNIAGSVTSAAAQFTLAPPGVNLSLGKVATASSVENPQGTPASAAIDGNLATRWGSSFANAATADTQWITVDLGAVMRFNRIVLRWENAYGKAYQIQVSNDNATWTKAYEQDAGVGGVEDFSFPTQQARYVRMQGITRGTQYGYSLWEFEIYNAANCGVQMGTAPERYTVQSPALVLDNLSGLTWSRSQYTYTDPGTQLTQPLAAQYCSAQGMRLPTKDEAVAISGSNSSSCAFPAAWNTWTSTGVPNQSTLAYTVGSTGALDTGLINNLPGWALCTAGATAAAPVITTQPAAVTAAAGGTAQFNVAATGSTPMAYVWSKNGTAVEETGVPTFTTPVLASTDNGELYSVAVIGGNGLTTESSTALLTVSGTVTPTPTPAPAPSTPNLALGKTATASSTENAANLGASQAVDGNLTTRWGSAFSDPQWIQIDFGSAVTFNQVILRWEAAYGKAYTLQVSSDAVNWTTAYTQTAGAGGTESFTFPAVTGRYVRMLGTARGTQYGYSLYEFEVYGTSAPSITTQPAAQTAVVGATATFSVGPAARGRLRTSGSRTAHRSAVRRAPATPRVRLRQRITASSIRSRSPTRVVRSHRKRPHLP